MNDCSVGGSVKLRPATQKDAGTIAGLHTLSWQSAYAHILPGDYLESRVPLEFSIHWQSYFARHAGEWGLVLIAEVNAESIGFVSAERSTDDVRGVLLDCLHVQPSFYGRGAGRLMIDAACAWALEIGSQSIHLFALRENRRAIRFYERNEWKCIGEESSLIGETPVVDLVFTKPTGLRLTRMNVR